MVASGNEVAEHLSTLASAKMQVETASRLRAIASAF
jgi:hypothetical protein